MFDRSVFEVAREAAASAAACDTGLATATERAEAIRTVRAAQDLLAGAESQLLADFDANKDFAEHGSPTTAAWVRRELRMTGDEARMRVAAGRTLGQLRSVRAAAFAGRIRHAHVRCFTAGITKCGLGVMDTAQDWLLEVAETCDPAELRDVIAALAEVVHPEELDKAWARGMDKQDIRLAKAGDGFHLTGFLDIVTGAQLKSWLDARSAPRDADDDRTSSQRRLDAVSELITSALEHGLPTDNGVRPQLSIDCDLDRLLTLMRRHHNGDRDRNGLGSDCDGSVAAPTTAGASAAAELAGFGPIGDELLSYLACRGDLTAILTNGFTTGPTRQANILNVGRSWRLATVKQRRAVLARQRGVCANPGCRHTQLEVHHVVWWSHGGATDLANLVGLCRRCHILIHQDRLTVAADGEGGFTFTRGSRAGRSNPVHDHRRTTAHAVRRRITQLTHPPEPEPVPEPVRPEPRHPRRRRPEGYLPPLKSIAEAELAGLIRRPRPHIRT